MLGEWRSTSAMHSFFRALAELSAALVELAVWAFVLAVVLRAAFGQRKRI